MRSPFAGSIVLVIAALLFAGCVQQPVNPGMQNTPPATTPVVTVIRTPALPEISPGTRATGIPAGTTTAGTGTIPGTTIISPGQVPVAGFQANQTIGTAPFTVLFSDLSIGSPTGWAWNFGDGNSSDLENPLYTYQNAGRFTVTLTVSNAAGSDLERKVYYITVNPAFQPPGAAYRTEAPSQYQPSTVHFFDTSSGPPTSWSWDFGDGGTSDQQNPVHDYPSGPGTYIVTLRVSNPAGKSQISGEISFGPG